MKDIKAKTRELINDKEKIESLLLLEKERREVHKDNLLFVGMANIAGYFWCATRAVLKSKINENEFFAAYLFDRISYSHELGLLKRLPKSSESLLDIGNEITNDDVEELLREKTQLMKHGSMIFEAKELTDVYGERIMIINPDLPSEQKKWYEIKSKAKGIRIADPEEFPKLRGEFLQTTKAEQYPSIRWNFERGKYVIVGVPDGITDRFVYEFKTTRNKFLMCFTKPVALTQANLYGYFFRRSEKRIQIHIVEEGTTETWQTNVDRAKALTVLKNFGRVDAGWVPPLPKKWKCKSCEYKQVCPASPN